MGKATAFIGDSVLGEKMRVHILAKDLNVPSKMIIEKCKAEGIPSVKNHMSTLSAGLHATICEWFSEEVTSTAIETSERVNLKAARLSRPKKKKKEEKPIEQAPPETEEAPPAPVAEVPPEVEAPAPAEVETKTPAEVATETPPEVEEPAHVGATEPEVAPTLAPDEVTAAEPAAADEAVPTKAVPPPAEAPIEEREVASAAAAAAATDVQVEPPPKPVTPAGPQNVPVPAKLQGPRVVRYEAPERDLQPVRRSPRHRPPTLGEAPGSTPPSSLEPTRPLPPSPAKTGRRKGRFSSRRAASRLSESGERIAEWRDRDLAERQQRIAGATGRRIHRRRTVQGATEPAARVATGPKTTATVHEPVRMKEFCSETGLNFLQLFKVLRDEHGVVGNLNMTLDSETAQLLALNFGIDLMVIPSKTLADELEEEYAVRERAHEMPRSPVVTLLGHVDHGKTSLLDTIRKTHVAADEDGGITQHISSYHIKTRHGAVTFVDTPGHAAFTAMRARGAQVTDVVVLVVAADDGVMPQTVEAIHHAKAAEVPIVVALNKIDLGDQNKLKIFGQLAEHDLTPSGEWGGEVDVIPTSATTGEGVEELVEHLANLSSLLELKADPELPVRGTVIEAETKPGVGPVAQVLIQEGTLRVGDFVVCGSGCGKVRALLNDRGERIRKAGPSIPVEVWGLDDVPVSGDKLYQLDNQQRAKSVAAEIKQSRITSSRTQSTKVKTLEEMFQQRGASDVAELNAIIKADVDGSAAALQHALGQFQSDEVKLTIRHAAVGAVNDSDVLLAEACEGIILAFRVDTAAGVRKLAEQRGVDVRPYRVIYDACDDIKKALEGLLVPEERIETQATAEVRQVFHISKLGMVAGSYVTGGTIDRNHFAKVLRDGVVVRDQCKFVSLKRFKDDVKEVRSGLECGIRLEGFDDLHVGDIIEAYEVLKIARTL